MGHEIELPKTGNNRTRPSRCLWNRNFDQQDDITDCWVNQQPEEGTTTEPKNGNNNDDDGDDDDDDEYTALYQQYAEICPHPQSLWFHITRSFVVVQEVALTIHFLLRYQLLFLLQQHEQQPQKSMLSLSYHDYWRLQEQQDCSSLVMVTALVLVVILNNLPQKNKNNPTASSSSSSSLSLTNKARHRLLDAALLGMGLHCLFPVLQSLTASYATDTVQTLALIMMLIHVLTCDYPYANGDETETEDANETETDEDDHNKKKEEEKVGATTSRTTTAANNTYNDTKHTTSVNHHDHEHNATRPTTARHITPRPVFEGGTVSLNAAFFATILLMSRLQPQPKSTAAATTTQDGGGGGGHFLCLLISVISFAFYPLTRHELAQSFSSSSSPITKHAVVFVMTGLLGLSTAILCHGYDTFVVQSLEGTMSVQQQQLQRHEQPQYHYPPIMLRIFLGLVILLLLVLPVWKYQLQFSKVHFRGPWDMVVIRRPQVTVTQKQHPKRQ